MTVDTSALVAILFREPGFLEILDCMLEVDVVRVGAPTLVETSLVFSGRRGSVGAPQVEALVRELGLTVVPCGEAEWRAATDAFARFGRGRHNAALNFGDCLAYATAAVAGEALLFVGDHFRQTDIAAAL